MAYKVNPISFRLGITRCWKTTNNICSPNYSYSFFNYYRYEQILFNFFYKHKFWVISSKLVNLSPFLLLIFCNFYKLNLNYRSLPVRKRRRKVRPDPDCAPVKRNWKHYFDKIYFTKSKIKSNIRKDFKGLYSKYLKKKMLTRKLNRIRKFILKKRKSIWKRSKKSLKKLKLRKIRKLKKLNKNKKLKETKKPKKVKKLKKTKKTKKIKKLRKNSIVDLKKWKKVKRKMRLLKKRNRKKNVLKRFLKRNFSSIYLMPIKLNYASKKLNFFEYNFFNKNNTTQVKKNPLYLTKIKRKILNDFVLSQSKKKKQGWSEHSYLNPKWEAYAIKNSHIREKLFFYFLQKNLKYTFKNKNIILKLRNINTLLYEDPNIGEWEDVLRTAYLTEMRRKYFVRTVFKDFFFMHRIAYVERDAQLFATILVSFFEMTRFHRNLLFLLKSVLHIFKQRYDYIFSKIKLKGRMQNRKRTKKIYLLRDSIPLNRLYRENTEIEYGQGTAVTFVGALSIKVWLYFLQS